MNDKTRDARRALQTRLKASLHERYVKLGDSEVDELARFGRNLTHREVAQKIRADRFHSNLGDLIPDKEPGANVKRPRRGI